MILDTVQAAIAKLDEYVSRRFDAIERRLEALEQETLEQRLSAINRRLELAEEDLKYMSVYGAIGAMNRKDI